MFDIPRFPIIILSSPRTYSTPIFDHLNRKYFPIEGFSEPDTNPAELERFVNFASRDKNFILKIHAVNLGVFSKDFLNNVIFDKDNFFIRIRRRSLIDQVASAYIASLRKVWVYHPGNKDIADSFKDQPIGIHIPSIQQAYQRILETNRSVDNLDINFDLDLYHEDVEGLETTVIQTPKPSNYQILYSIIKGLINDN